MVVAQQNVTSGGPAGRQTGTEASSVASSLVAPASSGPNRLQLDVIVTDKAGKPVRGLRTDDFTVLDENRRVVSMGSIDSGPAESPVEIILVLDAVNMGVGDATFVRQEFQNYFRQDNGHLSYPVSVVVFTGEGMRVRPAITDGNKLAEELNQVNDLLRKADLTNGGYSDVARFGLSMKWLTALVKSEAQKPGRKLMIWGGPGWPSLDGPDFMIPSKMLEGDFKLIVDLSTLLREGRVTLYSVNPAFKESKSTAGQSDPGARVANPGKPGAKGEGAFSSGRVNYGLDAGPFAYKNFLKGVKTPQDASPAHLGLKVLATQSGGLVLGPGNNLLEQINQCVQDATLSYRLSFNPPHAGKANEYHALKIELAEKNLVVRTDSGYYNQPQGQ